MRLYPFHTPIKSLYFRSFVVSVLFARFHFKVIRKSLYPLNSDLSAGLRYPTFEQPGPGPDLNSGLRTSVQVQRSIRSVTLPLLFLFHLFHFLFQIARWGPVEEEMACIRKHLDQQSISLVPMPQVMTSRPSRHHAWPTLK